MDMREMFTIDGRRFSNMAGFYDEVEQVFICGLDWKIGRNLNAFNDILRGGFGRHEYGQPIHIQWLAYEKSVRNLGKETMDTIVEIILDTDHSGHDCSRCFIFRRITMNRVLRIDEEKPEMHISVQGYKVTLCFAEKENPEVAVLVKQALLSAYAMPQK